MQIPRPWRYLLILGSFLLLQSCSAQTQLIEDQIETVTRGKT